jgi:drug/metabolite transporter (DMT)-like permease
MASPSFLAPFAYSSLPWSMVVTWAVWQITPGTGALLGTAIILASTTLTIRRPK